MTQQAHPPTSPGSLRRTVGLPGAVLLGLGSIIGTGVFASLAIGAGIAGAQLLPALVLAAMLASCNGLSSARLAATFPVSGGTYEYSYRTLGAKGPALGFAAGWLFLCAKSASCAAAALAFSGYVLRATGSNDPVLIKVVSVLVILLVTALVSSGLRRGNVANAVLVSLTLSALSAFALICTTYGTSENLVDILPSADGIPAFLQATALMFVAFTGYGRIATLGEEVRDPARTIPRAVVLTLAVALVLYLAVAGSSIAAVGARAFADGAGYSGAALAAVAQTIGQPELAVAVTAVSLAALCGVQLNLILGISRVILAMGRRQDLPGHLARLSAAGEPVTAVWATGLFASLISLLADLRSSWAFSAFTILIYYAITNMAALRLKDNRSRLWDTVSWIGLVTCLALAVFVDIRALTTGAAVLAGGFICRHIVRHKPAAKGDS